MIAMVYSANHSEITCRDLALHDYFFNNEFPVVYKRFLRLGIILTSITEIYQLDDRS